MLKKERVTIKIDGQTLPLNPFVRTIIHRTVLAMISTLKKVEISGEEKVEIIIRKR
jgi:hypothetical protein